VTALIKKGVPTMRFILGFLLGYCIRGKKPLLIATLATLTAIAVVCFIVLPTIALVPLAISVRHERLSRPPQTYVPALIGLDYTTAQIKLRDANLKIRVLANRHDPQFEPGIIIAQTPQGGERVDCGTVIGVTLSAEDPWR
jgi:beta-lactam-binding protein with PASTA domain